MPWWPSSTSARCGTSSTLLAVPLGLALGPRLVARRIDLRARSLSRHEYRLLAVGRTGASLGLLAAVGVVLAVDGLAGSRHRW